MLSTMTHQPILFHYVLRKKQILPMLELGVGYYSTYFLHEAAKFMDIELYSIETDLDWLNRFKNLESDKHHFIQIPRYAIYKNEIKFPDLQFSIALIDNMRFEDRKASILQLKDKVEIIIIHDNENGKYDNEANIFMYRKDFDFDCIKPDGNKAKRRVTVVSNKESL